MNIYLNTYMNAPSLHHLHNNPLLSPEPPSSCHPNRAFISTHATVSDKH